MTIDEVIGQFGSLQIKEDRGKTPEFAEFVILNEEQNQWNAFMEGILGEAAKPQGQKATKEDFALVKEYGGIYDSQILYKKAYEANTIIAMFWPWGDKVHTTLKIVNVKN